MLKNKMLVLLLSGSMMFLNVGCNSNNNNNNEVPSASTNGEMEEYVEPKENKPKYDFDKYNILTFGEIEIDNTPDYEGDTYIDFKNKVTNNSSNTIHTTTIHYGLYDEEGVLVYTTYPQLGDSIPKGQSFYMDGLYDTDEYPDVKNIKIIGYSYYIGDTYYTIDLIDNSVEIYE